MRPFRDDVMETQDLAERLAREAIAQTSDAEIATHLEAAYRSLFAARVLLDEKLGQS
jgi:hypothetical protein